MKDKNNLLFLFPGPKYDLEEDLGNRLKLLSRSFCGVAITYSSSGGGGEFGRFRVISEKIKDSSGFVVKSYKIFNVIKRNIESADVVISYDPLLTGLIGLYFARRYNKKLIVEVNGLHHLACTYVDKRLGSRLLLRFLYSRVMKFVIKRSDGVKLLFNNQLDGLGVDLKRKVVAVYHDYTNLDKFSDLGEEKVILCAGFPMYLKGIDILVKAFKMVSGNFPDWKLYIIGWFEKPLILEKLIGSHPNILVLKAIPHRDMHKYMGRCGIYAMPSRSEGMGRVFLEAARCGKPRIGSKVGGIPSVIDDGVDGLLVEPENMIDLQNKLDLLMRDDGERKRLGRAAYFRSVNDFADENYLVNTIRFYSQVLSE